MVERVVEIADAVVKHISGLRESAALSGAANLPPPLTTETILKGIHYYRIHDYIEQIALVNILPSVLDSLSQVKLIVIDSITFHFKHDFSDMGQRTRILQTLATQLMNIATTCNVAIVMVNQVTTRINNASTILVPALGESWTHAATIRVMLHSKDGNRWASLVKSPTNQNNAVPFVVLPEGIRGKEQE